MRSILIATFLLTSLSALAQNDSPAEKVYKSSENSVFLIYLNDSSGSPTALGSGFLVAPHLLITNAHVVDAGDPVLAVGPVRIPVKVLRKDEKNDLALISVSVDLTSNALPLASGVTTPGQQVFAIGNPEGLEKTISQGIVSGLRKRDDRNLIQITSPISHGSSGGPILDAAGNVVGVAVGLFEEGQNLNFAVPVIYAKQLLDDSSASPAHSVTASYSAADVAALVAKMKSENYASEADSSYQKDLQLLKQMAPAALENAKSPGDLAALACAGTDEADISDDGIRAARKLWSGHPTAQNRALLSYVLYRRASLESAVAVFSADKSQEKAAALSQQADFSSDAYREATAANDEVRGGHPIVATFVLGNLEEDKGNFATAIPMFQQVVVARPSVCNSDLRIDSLRSLVTDSDKLGRVEDAERWFRDFAANYSPSAYDWDSEGTRRAAAKDYPSAADAYEQAASGGADPADYCYATFNRYLQSPTDGDRVLSDGRGCVEASAKNTDKDKEAEYKAKLPAVYRAMAETLNDRGVYQRALEYVKEAIAGKSDDSLALYDEASIYENLGRYSECVAAAQVAISNSDGKYPYMQFQLGNCYFALEDWVHAESSYRISANADKTDAASAFNLGLSLQREGFGADARQWFNEALQRKPDPELRGKILSALSK